MPPKVRELIAELERNGFTNRGGKGSHRNLIIRFARKFRIRVTQEVMQRSII